MRVVVTGATGTIGAAVVDALRERGDSVVALSRDERRGRERLAGDVTVWEWPKPTRQPPPLDALRGADAIVHLLGEPIDQRWTAQARLRIRDSRVLTTRLLVEALRRLPAEGRPRTLVSQSAIGIYGTHDARSLDEQAAPGDDFLARMVVEWEGEARAADSLLRVVCTRTGVVLSLDGGAVARMLPFFRLGIGGPVAGGRQFVSWVHLDDVAGGMLRCLDDDRVNGAVNVTAPAPVTNAELSRALGRVLRRPAVLPVPAFALRLLYGEMAQVVVDGQRVLPRRLLALGHTFREPELEPALREALARR